MLKEKVMKRTIREKMIDLPYSLHDMHVSEIAMVCNDLTFKFADGFEQNIVDGKRVKGEIRFYKVDWDFCFVYVMDFCDNEGDFTGHKYTFTDFADKYRMLDFEIIDETYGYNSAKFAGWIWENEGPKECTFEIYHLGAMEYFTEE